METHWIVLSGASSSRDSVSSATLTIVVSRIDMITPTTTTAATIQTSRPSGSSAADRGAGIPFTVGLVYALTPIPQRHVRS